MTDVEDNQKAAAIVFTFLFVLYVIAQIILFLIGLAKFMFWVSLVGIVISLIASVYFFINRDDGWGDSDWIPVGLSLGVCLLLYLLAGASYQFGYSDEAMKTEMELKGYVGWYDNFTGLPSQAIKETIDNSCKNTPSSCEHLKAGYQVYESASGFKDSADMLSQILRITKRIR